MNFKENPLYESEGQLLQNSLKAMKGPKLWSPNTAYPEESLSLQRHHYWRKQQRWLTATSGAKSRLSEAPLPPTTHLLLLDLMMTKMEPQPLLPAHLQKGGITRYSILKVLCVLVYLRLIFGLTYGRLTQKLQCKMVLFYLSSKPSAGC